MDNSGLNRRHFLEAAGLAGLTLAGTQGVHLRASEPTPETAASSTLLADHIGGGDQNPGLESNHQAVKKWQQARIGFTMHFAPIVLRGTEIGWSRAAGQVPPREYDAIYKEFNPIFFDAKDWVSLIKDSGFRYVTLVSKHVDGFSMWATQQSDYNIMNTPFHRDWLKEMSEECRRQGVRFGVYYSIADWYQYDYVPSDVYRPAGGGPGFTLNRPPDLDRYVDFMKKQLKELIENYGSEIILLDAAYPPTWNHARASDLYRYLRDLRDDLVINDRGEVWKEGSEAGGKDRPDVNWVFYPNPFWNHRKYTGDYFEREQYVGGPAPYPWEAWITLGDHWSWVPNDAYKSAEECIRLLVVAAGGGGNFNLDVTPMPDGRFEQRQKDILLKIGAWLEASAESIYGTHAGPFEPGLWGASTRRDDKIYVHAIAWPAGNVLRLPGLREGVRSARRLNGSEVHCNGNNYETQISVPADQCDPLDTIVELTAGR